MELGALAEAEDQENRALTVLELVRLLFAGAAEDPEQHAYAEAMLERFLASLPNGALRVRIVREVESSRRVTPLAPSSRHVPAAAVSDARPRLALVPSEPPAGEGAGLDQGALDQLEAAVTSARSVQLRVAARLDLADAQAASGDRKAAEVTLWAALQEGSDRCG